MGPHESDNDVFECNTLRELDLFMFGWLTCADHLAKVPEGSPTLAPKNPG